MGNGRERAGLVWCESDYQRLFEAIGLGLSDPEIAEYVERSVGGVRARARLLLDDATTERDALPMLRRLAAAPEFDWDAWVREVHHREGLAYWDNAADEALRRHWAAEPPPRLQQLCEQFDVAQDVIARRAILLGLARGRGEVVDRFGALPGSGLALNAVLAADKLAAAVTVLVLTDTTGQVVHLSLHPHRRRRRRPPRRPRPRRARQRPGPLEYRYPRRRGRLAAPHRHRHLAGHTRHRRRRHRPREGRLSPGPR